MTPPGFDIRTLTEFEPPRYRCQRCLGLESYPYPFGRKGDQRQCKVCRTDYIPDGVDDVLAYLGGHGLSIRFEDLFGHAKELAETAFHLNNPRVSTPPVYVLLDLLRQATSFIHFVSWGIDYQMLGALRLASHHVPIAGVVSNVMPEVRVQLVDFDDESPRLKIRTIKRETAAWSGPHQKILIIDGLLACSGSANLTMNSWRKSAEGKDLLEVVTDIERVKQLNNRYFSPVWMELSPEQGPIKMTHRYSYDDFWS